MAGRKGTVPFLWRPAAEIGTVPRLGSNPSLGPREPDCGFRLIPIEASAQSRPRGDLVNPRAGPAASESLADALAWQLCRQGFSVKKFTDLPSATNQANRWYTDGRLRTLVGAGGRWNHRRVGQRHARRHADHRVARRQLESAGPVLRAEQGPGKRLSNDLRWHDYSGRRRLGERSRVSADGGLRLRRRRGRASASAAPPAT